MTCGARTAAGGGGAAAAAARRVPAKRPAAGDSGETKDRRSGSGIGCVADESSSESWESSARAVARIVVNALATGPSLRWRNPIRSESVSFRCISRTPPGSLNASGKLSLWVTSVVNTMCRMTGAANSTHRGPLSTKHSMVVDRLGGEWSVRWMLIAGGLSVIESTNTSQWKPHAEKLFDDTEGGDRRTKEKNNRGTSQVSSEREVNGSFEIRAHAPSSVRRSACSARLTQSGHRASCDVHLSHHHVVALLRQQATELHRRLVRPLRLAQALLVLGLTRASASENLRRALVRAELATDSAEEQRKEHMHMSTN